MIDRGTRDAAVDKVHYRMIDILHDWMVREKRNLDGFISHPEGHAEYNPYLIFDLVALQKRSDGLGKIAQGLEVIKAYKQGSPDATRSMHDNAVDNTPAVIWQRLHDWAEKRTEEMIKFLADSKDNPPVPISDYAGLVTFDVTKYKTELQMYKDAKEGLAQVIEFANQPKPI